MTFVARLHSRALIAIGGEDWKGFLHNLLTNDIEGLREGEVRFAGLLAPQGRLLFDLFVIGRDDGGLIDVAAARRDALLQRLNLYRLRARIRLDAVEGAVLAAWGGPRPGDGWAADPRLPDLGWRGYALDAGALDVGVNADEAAYDAFRLALGVPDPDADCPSDTVYPIEADFDLLNGIDFKKGCFVGQETTSRMKRRGQVRNRMLAIAFDGPPPPVGAEVLAADLRAGQVLTGGPGRAMALLRLDRIDGAALTVDGREVRVDKPRWLPVPAASEAGAL